MSNKKEIQDRINLLIRYSLKNTLTENKNALLEQSVVGAPNYGMTSSSSSEPNTSSKKRAEPEIDPKLKAIADKIIDGADNGMLWGMGTGEKTITNAVLEIGSSDDFWAIDSYLEYKYGKDFDSIMNGEFEEGDEKWVLKIYNKLKSLGLNVNNGIRAKIKGGPAPYYEDVFQNEFFTQKLAPEKQLNTFRKRGEQRGCTRPDKLIIPGKNRAGVSGNEAMVDGYPCTYPAPIPCALLTSGEYARAIEGTGISTLYLPENADVRFWDDFTEWTNYFERYWGKVSPENEEKVISYWLKMVPLGTVRQFSIAQKDNPDNVLTYRGRMTTADECGTKQGDWNYVFQWYFHESEPNAEGKKTLSPYPEMQFVDNRNAWQTFLDDHAFGVQMVLGVIYAITGMFCEGCTWALLMEIVMEGSLGVATAQRDLEKGDNISAALDLVFAVLPMLKTQKIFGAVTAQEGFEVINNMRKAGLSRTSKPTDVIRWYRRQAQETKDIFSKMIQGGDEWSEARVKKFLDDAGNDFFGYIRQHPKKLKDIPWYKTIHAKEAGIGAAIFPLQAILTATLGEKLNNAELERISKVHANIQKVDDALCQEFEQNLMANAIQAKEYANSPDMIEMAMMDPNFAGDPKLWQHKAKRAFGEKNYQEIPEDNTPAIQNQSMDTKTAQEKIKTNNFYTEEEVDKNKWWEKVGNIERINNITYYQVKDTTSTPTPKPIKQ